MTLSDSRAVQHGDGALTWRRAAPTVCDIVGVDRVPVVPHPTRWGAAAQAREPLASINDRDCPRHEARDPERDLRVAGGRRG